MLNLVCADESSGVAYLCLSFLQSQTYTRSALASESISKQYFVLLLLGLNFDTYYRYLPSVSFAPEFPQSKYGRR